MTFEDYSHHPNVGVSLFELPEDSWALRDVYERILTGQLLDPHEACDLLHGYIEDGEVQTLPTWREKASASVAQAPAAELSASESSAAESSADISDVEVTVESIVRTLWDAAYDTALAWDADRTDTDRFYEAVFELSEHADIDIALFSTIFDAETHDGQRGTGALSADAWRDFHPQIPTQVTLAVDSRRQDILISEIAINIADAFSLTGLDARINDDFSVTLSVTWRHHVLSMADALEAAALLPA